MSGAQNAVIYCRLSKRTDTNEPGLDAQEHDLRQLADDRGLHVVEVIREYGSADDNLDGRPGFARLVDLIRSDTVDVVLARHPDRLSRDDLEMALLRRDLREHSVTVATRAGEMDLSDPAGAMLATVTGAVATYENAVRRQRILAKHADLARRGQVAGGGARPFGFCDDKVTHHPTEAPIVREIAEALIGGASMQSQVDRLNDAGIRTTRGNPWRRESLRDFIRSARIAGQRELRGERYDAVWSGIITPDELDEVRAAIASRRPASRRRPRQYMMTGGIAVCGRCGTALHAQPLANGRSYACVKSKGGCGRLRIRAEGFEEYIAEAVLGVLDGPELAEHVAAATTAPDHLGRLRQIDTQTKALTEQMVDGNIPTDVFSKAMHDLGEQRRRIEAEMDAPDPLEGVDGPLRDAWPDLTMTQRRDVVGLVADRIVVGPGTPGRRTFDADRITIDWRV